MVIAIDSANMIASNISVSDTYSERLRCCIMIVRVMLQIYCEVELVLKHVRARVI